MIELFIGWFGIEVICVIVFIVFDIVLEWWNGCGSERVFENGDGMI